MGRHADPNSVRRLAVITRVVLGAALLLLCTLGFLFSPGLFFWIGIGVICAVLVWADSAARNVDEAHRNWFERAIIRFTDEPY